VVGGAGVVHQRVDCPVGQVVQDPQQAVFGCEIGYQEAVGGAEFADQVPQTVLAAGGGAIACPGRRRANAWPIPLLASVPSACRARVRREGSLLRLGDGDGHIRSVEADVEDLVGELRALEELREQRAMALPDVTPPR
jgi:hypothetical protein